MRIVSFVAGVFLALVALGLLAAGGFLLWAHTTQRNAQGYYTTGAHGYATGTYALTSEDVDLHTGPDRWGPFPIGTVRISVTGSQGEDLFVGIGPESEVDRYLSGVSHSIVTDVSLSPFRATTTEVPGSDTPPSPPAEQDFWSASASGAGAQTLTWDLEDGTWTIVVMNADASTGVDVRMDIGAKTGLLLPIGIGLLAGGVVFVGLAVLLIVVGRPSTWQRVPQGAGTPPPPPPPGALPPPPPQGGPEG
ncbi:MAG: hypothetical protein ACE14W_09365 [Candidatus Velamenicoccus archaeovorus]